MSNLDAGSVSGVRLDAAIERALSADGVDRITEVHLNGLLGTIIRGRRDPRETGLAAPGLRGLLMAYAMPHLEHPEVLQTQHHQALLERLSASLSDPDQSGEDVTVAIGALAVRRELRRLALLRQHQNSLIEA